jgi:hypothetical protein
VILDTKDAETIEQGNFTPFVDAQICEKWPIMADLSLGTPYNHQVDSYC